MTEEEFESLISDQIQDAADYIDEQISSSRADAIKYYQGEKFGNEVEGRSQIVTRDVRDAVQSVLPSLLKIFHSSDKILEFLPKTAADTPMAEQATDYVRYVCNQDNGLFMKLHACLKDSLLLRNGFLKAYWHESAEVEHYNYENLDDQQFAVIANDEANEVLELETRTVTTPQGEMNLNDVTVRRKAFDGRVKIECIPPEEVIISRTATSLEDAVLVGHRRMVRVYDLISMGFQMEDFEDHIASAKNDVDLQFNRELQARKPEINATSDAHLDDSQKEVPLCEAWVRIDYDGDDFAEMRHIIAIGANYTKILVNEPATRCPIFTAVCDPTPHDWTGLSFHDLLKDVQESKSSIMRSMLDSLALSVHPRISFQEDLVNLSDLLDSDAVGSLIRTRAPGAIQVLDVPFVGGQAQGVLDYFDKLKEDRTGVSKAANGLDPDALQSSTAASVQATISKAQEKLELIARIVAEQLLKPLYKHVLALVCEHQPKERIIKLRGMMVPMDPRVWDKDMDLSVNVGLGQGDEGRKLEALSAIKAAQEGVFQFAGVENPLVNIKQYYNTLAKLAEVAGYKDTSIFFTDPATLPPPPPPEPPPPTPEELLAQVEREKIMSDMQIASAKMTLEQNKLQTDAAIDVARMETDVQIKMLDLQGKYQNNVDVSQVKGTLEMQKELIRQQGLLEREKMKTSSYGSQ